MIKIIITVLGIFFSLPVPAQQEFVNIDRFVPHLSTVPANKGTKVGLYLHEKLTTATLERIDSGDRIQGVVLFVHGNSIPSVPDFDLPYRDYSWMAYLAQAGFDIFAMDHTGYGFSPRPYMDNPCNLKEEDQRILIPHTLENICSPEYPFRLNNSDSDWDEIDSVVDYIRQLRDVDKVNLIGWSWGGIRAGGYAARHPGKVKKLVLYAPAYRRDGSSEPVETVPGAGVPMSLQTRAALMQTRWRDLVECDGQIDAGIQPAIWQNIMGFDALGSTWHPQGVMRVRNGDYWGWNREDAARVAAATLILVGEQDFLLPVARELYPDLTGTENKAMAIMECATHFAVWEQTQYKFMQEASKEWLLHGTLRGQKQGIVNINANRP